MFTSLMVIDHFHLFSIAGAPYKTNTPLIVNPNAPLPFTFPLQRFKPVRSWKLQIAELCGSINRIKFHKGTLLNVTCKLSGKLAMKYLFGLAASKRFNHR